jgi:Rrf2 family protein
MRRDGHFFSSCNNINYMKRDSRLSGVLHVVLHMAEVDEPMTSEALAKVMQTHPVVVRRVMAGLRDSGLVRSEKGHGGGWVLSCNLSDITLGDIYNALDAPELFAMGNRTEAPGCLVEEAVNAALDSAFAEARQLLLDRLGGVTLAALGEDFHARLQARGGTPASAMSHTA